MAGNLVARAARILDLSLAEQHRDRSRWAAAATAEMEMVKRQLDSANPVRARHGRHSLSFQLLAAQLGLVCAEVPTSSRQWRRLRSLALQCGRLLSLPDPSAGP